jgi:hypothetical protein
MRLSLKSVCETSWFLVGDKWSNVKNDSVILIIVVVVSLIVDDHVVQDNVSTYDQIENALRVRPVRDG